MGPRGGDELNLIERGANYGWPLVSDGDHYDGRIIPDHDAADAPAGDFAAPATSWNPSISPGSLMIYRGDRFPNWTGDAFLGGLSGQALVRVELVADGAFQAERWPMGARIREVVEGPDGTIWLIEDGPGGRLLHLTPAP